MSVSPGRTSAPTALTTLLLSGCSGVLGWLPVHPIDRKWCSIYWPRLCLPVLQLVISTVVKIRMQLNAEGGKNKLYNSSVDAFRKILKTEGFSGLYGGLSAGLTRQATYTTLRGGIYNILKDSSSSRSVITNAAPPPLAVKLGSGLVAGGAASFICCPVEVALVRMQADGRLPLSQRRNYNSIFDALKRIVCEEGLLMCWRGSAPTVARAMVANMVQFASYDQAKELLSTHTPMTAGVLLHLSASIVSGFLYSAASLPMDNAKTRVQNAPDGNSYRGGIVKTMALIVRLEGGPAALWKGFIPYFARGGGHSVFMFLWLEQLRNQFTPTTG